MSEVEKTVVLTDEWSDTQLRDKVVALEASNRQLLELIATMSPVFDMARQMYYIPNPHHQLEMQQAILKWFWDNDYSDYNDDNPPKEAL